MEKDNIFHRNQSNPIKDVQHSQQDNIKQILCQKGTLLIMKITMIQKMNVLILF